MNNKVLVEIESYGTTEQFYMTTEVFKAIAWFNDKFYFDEENQAKITRIDLGDVEDLDFTK